MKLACFSSNVIEKRGHSIAGKSKMAVSVAWFLLITACQSREKFIDDTRRFAALSGQGHFQLSTVNVTVKKLVVNFFAPNCPPCEKEIPALKAFYAAHAADPQLSFISIGSSLQAIGNTVGAPTDAELRHEVKNFVAQFALPYPQHIASGDDLRSWRVTGFPETFVFERAQEGWKLRRKFISEISREALENELN